MSYEASRCSEMATRSFTIRSRTPPLHDLRLGRVRTAGQTGGSGTGAPMIGHRAGALSETGPQRARLDDRRGGAGAARPPSERPPAGRTASARSAEHTAALPSQPKVVFPLLLSTKK